MLDRALKMVPTRIGVAVIVGIPLMVAIMVASFDAIDECLTTGNLVGSSGWRLQKRLGRGWPKAVTHQQLSNGYLQVESTRDSFSRFIRFDANREIANRWVEFLATESRETEHWLNTFRDRFCESRTAALLSIPLTSVTGEVPSWWKPSGDLLGAFETMVWYTQSESGTARGSYLQFDSQSNCVWIYEYASQHERLWARGEETLQTSTRSNAEPGVGADSR